MPDFNKYMMRHGEMGIQFLIEHIERSEGIDSVPYLPLEQRWAALGQMPTTPFAA